MDYYLTTATTLLQGVKVTLTIFFVTLIVSLPLGLLGAFLKKSKFKVVVKLLDIYTWIVRGTPLLLQLFFVLYGFPIIFGVGYTLTRMESALLTFVINYTAYFIEIFRSGIDSIDNGQVPAAEVLGLTKAQTNRLIVAPQAIKKVIPTITNEAITLIKDTSLVASIAIYDILKYAKDAVGHDVRFEPYLVAAIFYLILSYGVVKASKKIEQKFTYYS